MSRWRAEIDELEDKLFRDVLKVFGERVHAARKAKGLTLQTFSDTVGVRIATLCLIEAGSTNVSLLIVFAIARVLGIDIGVLLDRTIPDDASPVRGPVLEKPNLAVEKRPKKH